jgi:hypothetical protein
MQLRLQAVINLFSNLIILTRSPGRCLTIVFLMIRSLKDKVMRLADGMYRLPV